MRSTSKPLIERITPPNRLPFPQSYLVALILVVVGAIVRWGLPGVLGTTTFLTFYPVLVVAAALGGLGPGLFAIALSWLCVTLFFDTSPGSVGFENAAEFGRLMVFLAGGLGVSIISEAQLRGKQRQMEQASKLKELNRLTDLGSFVIRNDLDQIVHWSGGCARLYGYSAEQALGRTIQDLLHTEFPKPLEDIREELFRTGRWEGELKHIRADGTLLAVSSQWVLREQDAGQAVLEIFTDITRLKQTEDSLRRATAELKRSNEDLQNFAYIASHDLQEPLRGINGFLTLLQQRCTAQLDEKAKEYVTYAVEGATRMSQLINDLLQYSRAGSKKKQLQPIDAGEVLSSALTNLRSALEEARAQVTHDNLPVVMGDPVLLTQVFQNLIGNAVKFRVRERPCQIHIGCRKDRAAWTFSVKDNGIGIEPENYDRVFEIFRRLNSKHYPGTGIGLAICKRIVEGHGGCIWVESKPGEGSTFHFQLIGA